MGRIISNLWIVMLCTGCSPVIAQLGGGVNNHFSQEFKDLAYRERQQLCQESSALYNLLRN